MNEKINELIRKWYRKGYVPIGELEEAIKPEEENKPKRTKQKEE